jgi:hypothetical protein
MADWAMPMFTVVVAVALFVEMVAIVAMYVAIRRMTKRVERLADYAQTRLPRLISKVQITLEHAQPRVSHYVLQASSVTRSAREDMERLDRKICERSDRFMMRFVQANEAITRALDMVEHTGIRTHHVLLAPGESVKSLLRGVRSRFESFLPGNRLTARPNDQPMRAN